MSVDTPEIPTVLQWPRSPSLVTGAQSLEPSALPPRVCISRQLEPREEPGREPRHAIMGHTPKSCARAFTAKAFSQSIHSFLRQKSNTVYIFWTSMMSLNQNCEVYLREFPFLLDIWTFSFLVGYLYILPIILLRICSRNFIVIEVVAFKIPEYMCI